jgi:hypothetical protein
LTLRRLYGAAHTVYALLLRSVVWVLIAAFAARRLLGRP